jgi:DNA polymerase-1
VTSLDDVQLTLVESVEEVEAFLRWLGERRPILGVDSETTGLSLAKDKLRMVQFGDAMHGWALPYRDWRGVVKHVLENYEGKLVLQHAKFDAGFLVRDGLEFPWENAHDTMIMNFLVDSLGPKSLKPAAALYLDPRARAGEEELKRVMRVGRWTYATIPETVREYWAYSAFDPVLTARLAEEQWPKVQQYREAYDLELACERVLCGMELRGIRIDVGYCERALEDLHEELDEVMERLGDLNPNAPAQVADALSRAGAPLRVMTEKGSQLSVSDDVLKVIDHPLARDVIHARQLQKLIGAYFENFLEYRDGDILHPHINQLAARTSRMSVTEPALQQIPRQALVRDAFIARFGRKLVLADYDNQELRVAASLSEDPAMLEAFARGADLHTETARVLYGTETCAHDKYLKCTHRDRAKNGMFSKAYGAGVDKFAKTVGLPVSEAQAIFATIDRIYPGLNRIMQRVTAAVKTRGQDTGYGWVRLIDGRHLRVRADKAYVGFNAKIQGDCAVVLKRSLVDLSAAGFDDFLVLPVHDEVAMDVPEEDLAEAVPEIERIMRDDSFRVPLTVGSKVVDRWGDPYREAA